ncbi:hypothetical protein COLO4_16242 [Corchorus olitorius]|uniref:Uncharacterized protein n=1 Tax=Corchorus olitorius TaxID=93759 RepID=A0A1R3JIN3_9ROSI|nr:hypothetical protein COLO4_16242 [Corchorus olitorius]
MQLFIPIAEDILVEIADRIDFYGRKGPSVIIRAADVGNQKSLS